MSISWKIAAISLVACISVLQLQESRVRRARAREAAAALETANAIAERDSTRDLARENARVARLVGDSIRVVEKRVVQVEQKNDALDRALGGERKAKYELVARVDSLRRLAAAPVWEDSGVRRASFAVRQAPYTVDADVAIPAPPDSARISLRVGLDPIAIEARIRCSKPDEHGVRTASVVVSAPTWASMRLERLDQSPDICLSAPAGEKRKAMFTLSPVGGIGIVGGGGRFVGLGYFLGVGIGREP